MRILFLTNYYPPVRYGWGYMQLCEEVADGLSAKGHAIAVLTSAWRDGDEIARPYPVHRLLSLDPDWHSGQSAAWQFFTKHRKRERQAIAHLCRLTAEFRPDVIFVWQIEGLPRLLLREAEHLSDVAVAYYVADYMLEMSDEYIHFWQVRPVHWTAKLLKRPLTWLALHFLAGEGKPVSLKCENVICVSDYIRRRLVAKGLVPEGVVIHNGVDLARFSPNGYHAPSFVSDGLRCLIAGRVVPDKGIHTAIDALVALPTSGRRVSLTILGDGPTDYREYLQRKIIDHGLQDRVKFHSPVPREQMPQVLAGYNTLILASEYAEPLARAMQEAMAMGLLVIGTTTGGSGELLIHERTGLAFEPASPESLAAQLARVSNEPDLAARLARAGQRVVVEQFNIQRTVEQIDSYLHSLSK